MWTAQIGRHKNTYLANHDARARLTDAESMNYGRVHRLDQIRPFIPANLLDSKVAHAEKFGQHRLAGIKTHIGSYSSRLISGASLVDSTGIQHSIEVAAESRYEA